jgi:hypothetical protein
MLMTSFSLRTILRAGAVATFAIFAVGTSRPAAAAAPRAPVVDQRATAVPTDISAARRQHHARARSPRDAYGSYVGGAGGAAPQTSSGSYGYGYGDNSRNQTW